MHTSARTTRFHQHPHDQTETIMRGSTYKHCGCRDADGRRLNKKCGKLRRPGHGSWYYLVEIPTGQAGRRRQQRRGGFTSQAAAQDALDDVLHHLRSGEDLTHELTVGQWLEQWLSGK